MRGMVDAAGPEPSNTARGLGGLPFRASAASGEGELGITLGRPGEPLALRWPFRAPPEGVAAPQYLSPASASSSGSRGQGRPSAGRLRLAPWSSSARAGLTSWRNWEREAGSLSPLRTSLLRQANRPIARR
jgi:hypothetical protein